MNYKIIDYMKKTQAPNQSSVLNCKVFFPI